MVDKRQTLRNRIIGVLLRDARQGDRRTKAECAKALGVSTSTMDAYEEGRKSISLPELEVLGYLLDTPLAHFLEREPELKTEADGPDFQTTLALRHRMVGALLRQARLEAGMRQEDLADMLDCSPDRIADYEYGEQPIPVVELELLSKNMGVALQHFLDGAKGTVGKWHRQEAIDGSFHELPDDLQEFFTKPVNIKCLELAKKLSEMPASKLRSIAEGLLELTR